MQNTDSVWELLVRPAGSITPEKHSRYLLVDPATGEIRGIQASNGSLMGWMAQLHYNLLLGSTGLALNAIAGALAVFFAVSGLILWCRGKTKWKNGLRLKLRGVSTRVRHYSIHSAIGFYVSLFLFAMGVSGVYFVAPQPFLSAAVHLQGNSLSVMKDFLDPPSSTSDPSLPDAPVNAVVSAAKAQFPAESLTEIELPSSTQGSWRFHFFDHSYFDTGRAALVVIDRRSTKVLAAHRTTDLPLLVRAVTFLRPLHYGSFGGDVTKVVWGLLGLSPAILFLTGISIWRKRVAASVSNLK